MKFDVTFQFEHCCPTITVDAENGAEAIKKARERDYPPVPDNIPACFAYSGPGGKRNGAGVKQGSSRAKEPRTIKKQIRWTEAEWAEVESKAKAAGVDIATYQRNLILKGD